MNRMIVRCWACGKSKATDREWPPQFGFEVVAAAQSVGFIGVFDLRRDRALIFCSSECRARCTLKRGGMRLRPPPVAAPEPTPMKRTSITVRLALEAAMVSQRDQLAEYVARLRSECEPEDPRAVNTAEALGAVEEQIDRMEAGCSEIADTKEGR